MSPVKDENPEMKRQIGCMNGLLQLFDIHYFIHGRRVNQKRLPSGQNGNQFAEPKCTLQTSPVKNEKILMEKQRMSTEPSLNKTLNSKKSNQSLDLQDDLKSSISREARGLSIKTVTSTSSTVRTIRHINTPRPSQPPKFSIRRVSNSNAPQKVERSRHYYDGRELHDSFKSSIKLKELPRLSLDSRVYRDKYSTSGTRSCDNSFISKQKEPSNSNRTLTVMAKLMGLEALPDSTSSREYKPEPISVQISPNRREVLTKSPRTASSVYGEIEKRLATLEFKESGKDLRALKHILEAMQKSKETADTKRKQASDLMSLNTRRNTTSDRARTSSRSPIIIMKPVKTTNKEGNITSTGQSNKKVLGLQMLQIDHSTDRKDKLKSRIPTDLSPRNDHPRYSRPRDASSQPLSPTKKRTNMKTMKVQRHVNEEFQTTSSTVTLSPRLHQKSSSNTPLSDLSSPRIQCIRHRTQPCSSDTMLQNIALDLRQNSNAHNRKKRNENRGLSQNKNASSLQFESIPSLGTSTYQKNSITEFRGIDQLEEPPLPSFEQPSPVSVLDSTFYSDDLSPIKKKLYTFQDDDTLSVNEDEVWLESETQPPNKIKQVDSETNHKKSANIQHLRKNLCQLKNTNEEKIADYIQLLNGRANPHHEYISEMIHSSEHLINPKLFFALEQTQNRNRSSNDEKSSVNMPKSDSHQKAQKRLVFDTVNEILIGQREVRGSFKVNIMEMCAKMKENQLLKDLFAQVDQLQFSIPRASLNENDNHSQMFGYDDSVHHSRNWTGSQNEISGLVLDIERLIFKDLITELVISEAFSLQD